MAELLKKPISVEVNIQRADGTLEVDTVVAGYFYEIVLSLEEREAVLSPDNNLARRALFAVGMDMGLDDSVHAPDLVEALHRHPDIRAIQKNVAFPEGSILGGAHFAQQLVRATKNVPDGFSFDAWLQSR